MTCAERNVVKYASNRSMRRDQSPRLNAGRTFIAMVAGLITAMVLVDHTQAQDSELSAKNMLRHCKFFLEPGKPDSDFAPGMCAGILATLFEIGPDLQESLRFCPPRGAKNTQTLDLVIRYAEQRQDRLRESLPKLATEAMREAWPCRAGGPDLRNAG